MKLNENFENVIPSDNLTSSFTKCYYKYILWAYHVPISQLVEKDLRNIEKQPTFVLENFVSQIAMLTSCRHGGDSEIRQNTKM